MYRGQRDPVLTLPEHLVERPVTTGWRRIGVGTAPFNVVSFGILIAISAFIVRSPSSDKLSSRAIADRSRPAATGVHHAPAAAAKTTPTTVTTVHDEPNASAQANGPVVRVVPVSTAPTPARRTTPRVTAPTTPPTTTVKHLTCNNFATQPAAQAAFDADRTGLAGLDGDGDGIPCEELPGRPSAPAAELIPTIASLEHPSTRLYGVHTPNTPYRTSEIADFTAAAGGKSPNTLMFFSNFSQDFPADAVAASWSDGALPLLTLEPILEGSTVGQPTLHDIAAGTWDEYLQRWAAAAKAQGQPFALRFAQEMNGDWYSWSDAKVGNQPGDFIGAWRHVHDVFAAAGVDNVIWTWSVNRVDNLWDKTLARVYPGDGYVDWAGISGYYRTAVAGVAPSFDGTFAATLQELKKVAPTKLVMLTEVGAGTTMANRTAWIESFFAGLLDHPEIIGFSWFNDFKDGGDWRIQYAGATASAFAAGVADIRYGALVPNPVVNLASLATASAAAATTHDSSPPASPALPPVTAPLAVPSGLAVAGKTLRKAKILSRLRRLRPGS